MTEASPRSQRATNPGDFEAGDELDGRYRIIRALGSGGMGVVYEAEQIKLRRRVALKLMHPERAKRTKNSRRFLREAQAASSVEHPNVVDILDFGELDNGTTYLVMELLHGTDLDSLLETNGPLDWARTRGILLQVLGGLQAAHDNKIIHRDIKPANVFLLDSDSDSGPYPDAHHDRVKVLDFGIARFAQADRQTQKLTGTAEMLGTATYMAPELALNKPASVQSDIYAVGVLAYEMLTGSTPFDGSGPIQVLLAHVNEPLTRPRKINPGIPRAVEAIIMRALAKDPAERFHGANELREALVGIDEKGIVVLSPTSGSWTTRRRSLTAGAAKPGSRVRMLGLGVLGASLLGAATWAALGAQPPRDNEAALAASTARDTSAQAMHTAMEDRSSRGAEGAGAGKEGKDEQRTDEQRTDEQRTDEQRTDEQPTDEQTKDQQSTGSPNHHTRGPDQGAMVHFDNRLSVTVKIFSADEDGREHLHASVSPGKTLEVATSLGQQWVVRRSANGRTIRAAVVDKPDQTIVIEKVRRRSGSKSTAHAKPQPEPPPPLPRSPQEQPVIDMMSVKANAKKASRACGQSNNALFTSVEVKLEIKPDGTVAKASVKAPHLGTPVGTCVAKAVGNLKFPKNTRRHSKTWTLPL